MLSFRTDAESERRARQIEVLQSKHSQLKAQYHNSVQSSYSQNNAFQADEARQQLFGNTSGVSRGNLLFKRPIYVNVNSAIDLLNILGKESGDYKSVDWGTGSDDEELLDTSQVDVESARKTRTEIIKGKCISVMFFSPCWLLFISIFFSDQDRGLDELSKILARQRNIAENIGSEVALHNGIVVY